MTVSPGDIPTLIEMFKQGTAHLKSMAESFNFPWNPQSSDPKHTHNIYARNLITCYVSKFSDLSESIINAIENNYFLTYALCGRALIENTATLRYYVLEKYKPLMDKGSLTQEDMRELIEIDDQHLRGTRFDWESFLFINYEKLKTDAVEYLKNKKTKKNEPNAGKIIMR